MLSTLRLRVRAGLTRLVVRTKRLLHEAIRPLPVVVGVLRDLTRSRGQLIAENALLRQQLIVASRKVKRPVFKDSERGLLVLLSRIVHGWQNAVLLVKPETILILGRRHLAHVLGIYSRDYFNQARPHQGIGQRVPVAVATEKVIAGATIRSVPVLGGLHHD